MIPPQGCAGYGGLEPLAWQKAKGLAAKGHTVFLIGPDGSECPGVSIVPIGPERQVSEEQAFQKYAPLLPTVDCVVDETWTKMSYTMKAAGQLKPPILGTMHAPVNTMYSSLPPVEKPCIVCISQDQANHFEALFSRPCRWAHHGIDTDFYKPLEIPRTDRFLFLARFSTIKGPSLAIEACIKAGVGLDLVGDTSITNEPEYLEQCRSMCDGKQIRMVGPATRGETVWWYSQAHCMLHPNMIFREPFGLAPVEAMACACPVIAWDYGAMRETIKTGETGRLVKSMDEFTQATRYASFGDPVFDGEKVPDMWRKNCREWVADKFPLQKMIDRWEQLIIEAVETGGW